MMYKQNSIESFSFFQKLTESEQQLFLKAAEVETAGKSKVIFKKNDTCDSLYLLVEGSVKIFSGAKGDKEYISNITHAINIFGECCLFGRQTVGFNAMSLDANTRYYKVPIAVIKNLMSVNFEFNMELIAILGRKIEQSENRLAYFSTRDARSRIIEFLKANADQVGRKVGEETFVKHGLTQQDIANYTGTSRQTVTTVLNSLKSENQIYLRRKCILIRDIEALN